MRLRRALWALSVVALGALPLAAQETAKADKPVKRDEVIRRAYTRARQSEDRTLLRLTLAPNEDATVVAVAEYGTGDIGIFVGFWFTNLNLRRFTFRRK